MREGETIEGSRTTRNRPYPVRAQVLKTELRGREGVGRLCQLRLPRGGVWAELLPAKEEREESRFGVVFLWEESLSELVRLGSVVVFLCEPAHSAIGGIFFSITGL